MLSVSGKKVLHIDRNDYYGGFYFIFIIIINTNYKL